MKTLTALILLLIGFTCHASINKVPAIPQAEYINMEIVEDASSIYMLGYTKKYATFTNDGGWNWVNFKVSGNEEIIEHATIKGLKVIVLTNKYLYRLKLSNREWKILESNPNWLVTEDRGEGKGR